MKYVQLLLKQLLKQERISVECKIIETRTHFSRMQTTRLQRIWATYNLKGCRYFYFDLDVTFTLICNIDLINDL